MCAGLRATMRSVVMYDRPVLEVVHERATVRSRVLEGGRARGVHTRSGMRVVVWRGDRSARLASVSQRARLTYRRPPRLRRAPPMASRTFARGLIVDTTASRSTTTTARSATSTATTSARATSSPSARTGDDGYFVPLRPRTLIQSTLARLRSNARGGGENSRKRAPSWGLEWPGFEAASKTDPAGRRTVHFPETLLFHHRDLRMTPVHVTSDISRWL